MLRTAHFYHLCKSMGWPSRARLSRWRAAAKRVVRLAETLRSLTDQELITRALDIRWRAKAGISLESLAEEGFALVRESSRRTIGLEHYPVQVMGGFALLEGNLAEMQTGEGKTLTATLPTFMRALVGRGAYVITVNDYLAERDARTMGPVYEALGLSVGCIQTPMEADERRAAYANDITYGTAKEMGFDFLRDRLRTGANVESQPRHPVFGTLTTAASEPPVQRGYYFALLDEADSILIDEARTPLIIGLTQPNDHATVNLLRWCVRSAQQLTIDKDFVYEPDRRSAYLTDAGCRRVLLMAKPPLLDSIDTEKMYKHVEHALTARYGFLLDRDYVVMDEKVVIVDEGTGRMMEGRKWQDGLHQAVEAKERVPITAASGQAARITVASFFREFSHLAGMTGTAIQAARELKKVYKLGVSVIPTHRLCIRQGLVARIFATADAKWSAIVEEVVALNRAGRAVLIGTPSVEASEALSQQLEEKRIRRQVLNARYLKQEAEIIAQAGQPGKVTIATNMAGRGTDIELAQSVRDSGGLHVIATEMHSSKRIDRQLVGRAARQGDPGSFQFFLSIEDELLRALPARTREVLKQRARANRSGELNNSWLNLFQRTQRKLEKLHRKQRKELLKQEKQRNESYEKMGLDPYLELTE